MKTGVELIAEERQEQIEKHNRTIESDVEQNDYYQLSKAASILCLHEDNYGCNEVDDFVEDYCPDDWKKELWRKMLEKPYKERLKIAGALIAAEIDRLQSLLK
jgi:hypothetical protein